MILQHALPVTSSACEPMAFTSTSMPCAAVVVHQRPGLRLVLAAVVRESLLRDRRGAETTRRRRGRRRPAHFGRAVVNIVNLPAHLASAPSRQPAQQLVRIHRKMQPPGAVPNGWFSQRLRPALRPAAACAETRPARIRSRNPAGRCGPRPFPARSRPAPVRRAARTAWPARPSGVFARHVVAKHVAGRNVRQTETPGDGAWPAFPCRRPEGPEKSRRAQPRSAPCPIRHSGGSAAVPS